MPMPRAGRGVSHAGLSVGGPSAGKPSQAVGLEQADGDNQSASVRELEWLGSTTIEGVDMTRNGMRPIHPGEILRQEFLLPLAMTARALSQAIGVPATRVNDIGNGRRGVTADGACGSLAPSAIAPSSGAICRPHVTGARPSARWRPESIASYCRERRPDFGPR